MIAMKRRRKTSAVAPNIQRISSVRITPARIGATLTLLTGATERIWIPLAPQAWRLKDFADHELHVFAHLKPDVPLPQIPTAFVYLGCWFLMAGAVYYFLGIETRGKSIEQIDKELAVTA